MESIFNMALHSFDLNLSLFYVGNDKITNKTISLYFSYNFKAKNFQLVGEFTKFTTDSQFFTLVFYDPPNDFCFDTERL